ncbi:hypothetical protein H9P43_003532 [Blastocladiella emersonii ATCC 22665]|nr:hypothetical protein H9P43_003532 [Blastocladiella emersonii ATCC 22665]
MVLGLIMNSYDPALVHGAFALVTKPLMPAWLLALFFPRATLTRRLLLAYQAVLASVYIWQAVSLIFEAAPPGVTGLLGSSYVLTSIDLFTLPGIVSFFHVAADHQVAAAWQHYLAFDLFVGWSIARDAEIVGISKFIVAPCMFFTLMLGPTGVGMYLLAKLALGKFGVKGQALF